MKQDENGYIVVETIGSFIMFVLLIVSILSLVNIVTLQSRVHYALTQSANALSMYSYTLHATGIANNLMRMDEISSEAADESRVFKDNLSKVIDGISQLSPSNTATQGEAVANKINGSGEDEVPSPQKMMQTVLNYGLNEGRSALFEECLKPLVGRYLGNGKISGSEYLEQVNVIGGLDGLVFHDFTMFDLNAAEPQGSVLIDQNGDIKLLVQYEIEYKFGALPLPFEPKLKVTQTARTKAWLGGRGDGFRYD